MWIFEEDFGFNTAGRVHIDVSSLLLSYIFELALFFTSTVFQYINDYIPFVRIAGLCVNLAILASSCLYVQSSLAKDGFFVGGKTAFVLHTTYVIGIC
jgi:hypothetical protein